MWVLYLEAGVALGLLVFIMWWTLGSTRKREKKLPPKKTDKD
jgi:hypothetical protein